MNEWLVFLIYLLLTIGAIGIILIVLISAYYFVYNLVAKYIRKNQKLSREKKRQDIKEYYRAVREGAKVKHAITPLIEKWVKQSAEDGLAVNGSNEKVEILSWDFVDPIPSDLIEIKTVSFEMQGIVTYVESDAFPRILSFTGESPNGEIITIEGWKKPEIDFEKLVTSYRMQYSDQNKFAIVNAAVTEAITNQYGYINLLDYLEISKEDFDETMDNRQINALKTVLSEHINIVEYSNYAFKCTPLESPLDEETESLFNVTDESINSDEGKKSEECIFEEVPKETIKESEEYIPEFSPEDTEDSDIIYEIPAPEMVIAKDKDGNAVTVSIEQAQALGLTICDHDEEDN